MRYFKQTRACCRHGVSTLIAGGLVAMPVSSAYAETIDELVETVTSSTTLTFGVGAAAGAVVAGLVGILLHARSKRKLKRRIEGLEQDVESARELQRDAEARLQQLEEQYESQTNDVIDTQDAQDESVQDESLNEPVQDAQSLDVPLDESGDEGDVAEQPDEPGGPGDSDGPDEPAQQDEQEESSQTEADAHDDQPVPEASLPNEEDHPKEVAEVATTLIQSEFEADATVSQKTEVNIASSDNFEPVSFETRKTVKAVLEERLTPDALNEGTARYSKTAVQGSGYPAFVGHRRTRQYDPVVRASLIDQRVPRFDESLFPDVVSHVHDEVDIFETAMRAMEDTLQHTAVLGIEAEVPGVTVYEESESGREFMDVSAYVDYLLQDEIEKTMSGEPLTTNHPHLTMFDGTGDLKLSKKLGEHRPDHMRLVNDEG